jgi:hypothetical protein
MPVTLPEIGGTNSHTLGEASEGNKHPDRSVSGLKMLLTKTKSQKWVGARSLQRQVRWVLAVYRGKEGISKPLCMVFVFRFRGPMSSYNTLKIHFGDF